MLITRLDLIFIISAPKAGSGRRVAAPFPAALEEKPTQGVSRISLPYIVFFYREVGSIQDRKGFASGKV